jgi:hypothetical protein
LPKHRACGVQHTGTACIALCLLAVSSCLHGLNISQNCFQVANI